jgi:hypothetical protein
MSSDPATRRRGRADTRAADRFRDLSAAERHLV